MDKTEPGSALGRECWFCLFPSFKSSSYLSWIHPEVQTQAGSCSYFHRCTHDKCKPTVMSSLPWVWHHGRRFLGFCEPEVKKSVELQRTQRNDHSLNEHWMFRRRLAEQLRPETHYETVYWGNKIKWEAGSFSHKLRYNQTCCLKPVASPPAGRWK